MTTTAIPTSKRKLILSFLGACLFVVLGIWLLRRASRYDGIDAVKAYGASLICIVFFGAAMVILAKKLFDKRAGLVLNEQGIHRMGLFGYQPVIQWEHITHCSETKVKRTRLLLIHVDNVEEILAGMSGITRQVQKLALAQYGTPFSLSSANLQCDFDEMRRLIESAMRAKDQHVR